MEITDVIYNALQNKSQVDVVYFDLTAAFDSVGHKLLLQKLSNIGFSPKMIKWFMSYITGRSFMVKANNVRSTKDYMYRVHH